MPDPIVKPVMMSYEHTLAYDDMHFVMRQVFFEDGLVLASGSLQHNGTTPPLPNLPLVLYQNFDHFFSMLRKTSKFQQVHCRPL